MLNNKAFLLLWLATQTAQANLYIPAISTNQLNTLALQDQTLAHTGLTTNEDDLIDDQDLNKITLNAEQTHEAKVWGLTIEEEKRYVLLMQNKSKIYYQGLQLSPLDILGINARSEAERDHFAQLAAQQEAQKVAKNIAWNNAFYKAYNKLFINVPVVGDFDPSPYSPYAHRPVQLNQDDILYFFITAEEPVITILLSLIDAIEATPNTYLHIMILNNDNLAIQLWANQHQIPQTLVNAGRITLNHGDLNFQALKLQPKTTPLLLLARGNHSNRVDLGRF